MLLGLTILPCFAVEKRKIKQPVCRMYMPISHGSVSDLQSVHFKMQP